MVYDEREAYQSSDIRVEKGKARDLRERKESGSKDFLDCDRSVYRFKNDYFSLDVALEKLGYQQGNRDWQVGCHDSWMNFI